MKTPTPFQNGFFANRIARYEFLRREGIDPSIRMVAFDFPTGRASQGRVFYIEREIKGQKLYWVGPDGDWAPMPEISDADAG